MELFSASGYWGSLGKSEAETNEKTQLSSADSQSPKVIETKYLETEELHPSPAIDAIDSVSNEVPEIKSEVFILLLQNCRMIFGMGPSV